MDFVPIFDGEFSTTECVLWAVQYDNESIDELERLFDLWSDIDFLRRYFKQNRPLLTDSFWQNITQKQAVFKAMEEAASFENSLMEIGDNGHQNDYEKIKSIFRNLHENEYDVSYVSKKGKPVMSSPFLRIYAIELQANQFLVTGGGIKLTKSMAGTPGLTDELQKIKEVKTELTKRGLKFLD